MQEATSLNLTGQQYTLNRTLGVNVVEAGKDLRHLLGRGFNRESAVRFVADRYQLSRTERLILYRGVYDKATAQMHRRKTVSKMGIRDKRLAVDGYNVMITLESALLGRLLILCDDGIVRDVSAVHSKYRSSNTTDKALDKIVTEIASLKPSQVMFFLDGQISKSGELASLIRAKFAHIDQRGGAVAARNADSMALSFGEVVATSDSALIERAEAVTDLAGIIIKEERLSQLSEIRQSGGHA